MLLRRGVSIARTGVRSFATGPGGNSLGPVAQPPVKSNNNLLSRALIAAAVAAPVGFGLYKWQYDPEFPAIFIEAVLGGGETKKKSASPMVEAPAQSAQPAPLPVPAAPAPPVMAAIKDVAQVPDEKINSEELDELERKLVKSVSVTYPKREVEDVEKRIDEAQKAADEKHQEEGKKTSEPEQEPAPASTQPAEPASQVEAHEPTPAQPQRFERQAMEAIRDAAKKVEHEAASSSKTELAKAEAQLRADIERVLAKDLSSLTEEGLRERVVQLTLELKDRNRWEAIRLHEVITKTIEDLSQKYLAMMKEQEAAYESVIRAEVSNAAMDAAAATEERLSRSLQDRLARQREALRMEMDLNIDRAREEERQAADEERRERTAALHEMENKLIALEEAMREKDRVRLDLQRTKRAILAALRFSRVTLIEKSTPQVVEETLTELRLATAGDRVISEALDALPHRVFASGVASIHKLAKTFEKDVKPDVLRASLIPENASLVQQALARATTALMITGKPSTSPTPEDSSIDAQCVRIQAALDQEDLITAVNQAQSLPAGIVDKSASLKDWLSQAQDRLRVEAAIRLLTARFENIEQ